MTNYDQCIHYEEHLDVYRCIVPLHRLHIDKIAPGAHLHVALTLSILWSLHDGLMLSREMCVVNVYIETCIN